MIAHRFVLPVATVVAVAVAAVLGVLTVGQADRAEGNRPTSTSPPDKPAGQALTERVTDLVGELFTVHPDSVDRTKAAARDALIGDAVHDYRRLYGDVLADAREQQLSLTTTVDAVGIETLSLDTAAVLVFASQRATRPGSAAPNVGAAQIGLRLRKAEGGWKIDDIIVL